MQVLCLYQMVFATEPIKKDFDVVIEKLFKKHQSCYLTIGPFN
ncbi:hypothetical protein [Bacillus sp. TL12]|nr:hypothetical protein [Bacillus sp. TL12]